MSALDINTENFFDLIETPIETLAQAKTWIQSLDDWGLDYHLDDCAIECLDGININGLNIGAEFGDKINARSAECFNHKFDWGAFDCPHGFCIAVSRGI